MRQVRPQIMRTAPRPAIASGSGRENAQRSGQLRSKRQYRAPEDRQCLTQSPERAGEPSLHLFLVVGRLVNRLVTRVPEPVQSSARLVQRLVQPLNDVERQVVVRGALYSQSVGGEYGETDLQSRRVRQLMALSAGIPANRAPSSDPAALSQKPTTCASVKFSRTRLRSSIQPLDFCSHAPPPAAEASTHSSPTSHALGPESTDWMNLVSRRAFKLPAV